MEREREQERDRERERRGSVVKATRVGNVDSLVEVILSQKWHIKKLGFGRKQVR